MFALSRRLFAYMRFNDDALGDQGMHDLTVRPPGDFVEEPMSDERDREMEAAAYDAETYKLSKQSDRRLRRDRAPEAQDELTPESVAEIRLPGYLLHHGKAGRSAYGTRFFNIVCISNECISTNVCLWADKSVNNYRSAAQRGQIGIF